MKEFDMNGYVRVKLNKFGRYIASNMNIEYDKDGYLYTQLWKLMKDFGKYISLENPFDEFVLGLDEKYILNDDEKTK